MESFPTFDKAYKAILKELICQRTLVDPRGLPTRELLHYTWTLENPADHRINFQNTDVPERQTVYDKYLKEELEWYLSGSLNADLAPSKFWLKLADHHGKITSNYGHMVLYDKKYRGQTAMEYVVSTLVEDRASRRAVIHYGESKDFWPDNKDTPCTIVAQVLIRQDRLHMHIFQRSVDAVMGLGYDIPWHAYVMQEIFRRWPSTRDPISLGRLVHTCGSLHLYEKDLELARKIIY
jgi:thymidylate synthase